MKNYKLSLYILILITVYNSGCKKFVQIPAPNSQLVTSSVFNNDASATSAQTVIYTEMVSSTESFFMAQNSGLLSDELDNYSTAIPNIQLYTNAMTSALSPNGRWNNMYKYIYQANAVIEGLQKTNGASEPVKTQLIGEAKFIRAFYLFYLTNLYGDIPLVTTSDYTVNSTIARSPKQVVYQQLIKDLIDASGSLNSNYVDGTDTTITNERVRPTKWAATALLARVYLYNSEFQANNYSAAETAATEVINNTAMFSLCPDLNSVFLANSPEAIWQLMTPMPASNAAVYDGRFFILRGAPSTSSNNSNTLSNQLLNSFEPGDNRKVDWINSITTSGSTPKTYYFPFKYKLFTAANPIEYTMVLRLAEQYLIRAEARAQQGNVNGALSDLNVIRSRAGLPNYSGPTDKASLLGAILHERQVELFTEWGNRWFDLIRTGSVNSVMSVVTPGKGGIWANDQHQLLYPIPQSERNIDPNLTQNPGY